MCIVKPGKGFDHTERSFSGLLTDREQCFEYLVLSCLRQGQGLDSRALEGFHLMENHQGGLSRIIIAVRGMWVILLLSHTHTRQFSGNDAGVVHF